MPPHTDDQGVADEQFLLRALKKKWVTKKEGRERPTSESLTDSTYENSCFIEGEIGIAELQLLFPGHRIARIPVRVVRAAGFVLERRPQEAPEACSCPLSHVVIGPTQQVRRIEYENAARQIVKHPDVIVVPE